MSRANVNVPTKELPSKLKQLLKILGSCKAHAIIDHALENGPFMHSDIDHIATYSYRSKIISTLQNHGYLRRKHKTSPAVFIPNIQRLRALDQISFRARRK